MKPVLQIVPRLGCLISVAAPILGFVLYPRANWLFLFVFLGVALLAFTILTSKDPTPRELAGRAEALLYGNTGPWDVDDYEHMNPKDPRLKDLWGNTMRVGGLPEAWPGLSEEKKAHLRTIIQELKDMDGR